MVPRLTVLLLTALLLLNILVFAQTLRHEFVHYDDGQFVFENQAVRDGLAPASLRWAWTSTSLGYYPLTWMSHMLDVRLYGLRPGGHHATAVLLHILATWLLFLALQRLTGDPVRSAIVAALFAVHPMHVESVAWISERKDTLSTLFGMLALAFYTSSKRLAAFLALAASLLSKQMLMTLPFVFLLLDYWPLARRDWRRAVLEKLPFFALTAGAVALAFVGQSNLHAFQPLPLSDRIGNAIVAYAGYLKKLVWPAKLAVLYPFTPPSTAEVVLCALLLLAITAGAFVLRRKAPWLIVGWLWFLGTLVPVIGLIQIGAQSMADRYSYFPYIGLFIAITWSVRPKWALVPAVAVLTVLAFNQTRYWKNSETLFSHALDVTGPNPVMEYSLGQTLELTDPDRSLLHLRRALEVADPAALPAPQAAQIHAGIGAALMMKGSNAEAAAELRKAIELDPAGTGNAQRNLAKLGAPSITALFDRGLSLLNSGDANGAIEVFHEAADVDPNAVDARIYLALAQMSAGRNGDAIVQLEKARSLDAAKANAYITKALGLPAGANNLDDLIARLRF